MSTRAPGANGVLAFTLNHFAKSSMVVRAFQTRSRGARMRMVRSIVFMQPDGCISIRKMQLKSCALSCVRAARAGVFPGRRDHEIRDRACRPDLGGPRAGHSD